MSAADAKRSADARMFEEFFAGLMQSIDRRREPAAELAERVAGRLWQSVGVMPSRGDFSVLAREVDDAICRWWDHHPQPVKQGLLRYAGIPELWAVAPRARDIPADVRYVLFVEVAVLATVMRDFDLSAFDAWARRKG